MSKKKKRPQEKKISPTPPYKKRSPRKKKQTQTMKDYSLLSAHACACEGKVDDVRLAVDQAVELLEATEDDRKLWLKMANRNLNSFLNVFLEFEIDLKEKGYKFRSPIKAFQQRLNVVLPKNK